MLIILCVVLLIPIAYYFCYALPQHNIAMQEIEKEKLKQEDEKLRQERQKLKIEEDKAAYEKAKIDLERQTREIEERNRQREKEEKEANYHNCIETANRWREENFKSYCELWYKTCTEDIDYWNNLIPNSRSYSECEDYRFKNNECKMKNNYAQEWKEWYERQLKMCDRYS